MSWIERINADIKSAMLAKQKERLPALRAIKSALLIESTKEGGDGTVADSAGNQIVQKLFKQRNDSAKIYNDQGRTDLAEAEIQEANVIKEYLPEMMSETDVCKIVKETIAAVGAMGPSDMGKVMGPVMGKLKGKADGSLISKVVKEELSK